MFEARSEPLLLIRPISQTLVLRINEKDAQAGIKRLLRTNKRANGIFRWLFCFMPQKQMTV